MCWRSEPYGLSNRTVIAFVMGRGSFKYAMSGLVDIRLAMIILVVLLVSARAMELRM
jgi:hypothetical protein